MKLWKALGGGLISISASTLIIGGIMLGNIKSPSNEASKVEAQLRSNEETEPKIKPEIEKRVKIVWDTEIGTEGMMREEQEEQEEQPETEIEKSFGMFNVKEKPDNIAVFQPEVQVPEKPEATKVINVVSESSEESTETETDSSDSSDSEGVDEIEKNHIWGLWEYQNEKEDMRKCYRCGLIEIQPHHFCYIGTEIKEDQDNHIIQEMFSCDVCYIATQDVFTTQEHSYGDWKYVAENDTEERACKECMHLETRSHQHEEPVGELTYVYQSSNNDGTHNMEASYTCSVCQKIVTITKSEACVYVTEYEKVGTSETHTEVKQCKTCQYTIRTEEECTPNSELSYVYQSSNNDGTHNMEASYTCSVCQKVATRSKSEACVYVTDYEWSETKDIHIVVHTCSICQYVNEQEGACVPTGKLTCIKETDSLIYEYYECELCGDRCNQVLHTVHQFEDWEYRDEKTHMRYCICTEEREEADHVYVYDGNTSVICEVCGHAKDVVSHVHGANLKEDMDLMILISTWEYKNEIISPGKENNPNPSLDEPCYWYNFKCKICGAKYKLIYNHKFENGVCVRKHCGISEATTTISEFDNLDVEDIDAKEGTVTEAGGETEGTTGIEDGTDTEGGNETEGTTGTEDETDTEGGNETEGTTGTEDGTDTEGGNETEGTTGTEDGTDTEGGNETEGTTGTEDGTDTEGGSETEGTTGTEDGTDTEDGNETEDTTSTEAEGETGIEDTTNTEDETNAEGEVTTIAA